MTTLRDLRDAPSWLFAWHSLGAHGACWLFQLIGLFTPTHGTTGGKYLGFQFRTWWLHGKKWSVRALSIGPASTSIQEPVVPPVASTGITRILGKSLKQNPKTLRTYFKNAPRIENTGGQPWYIFGVGLKRFRYCFLEANFAG